MARRRKKRSKWPRVVAIVALVWLAQESRFWFPKHIRPPDGVNPVVVQMKTTAYCHCHRCCSYKWFLFIPYQKTGALSFRIKHVGKTSSGTLARPGTIAADTTLYPYGTIMYIPGYGYGRVEDTGGAIQGNHIDLFRPNHWLARHWGVRTQWVKLWLPQAGVAPPGSPAEKGGIEYQSESNALRQVGYGLAAPVVHLGGAAGRQQLLNYRCAQLGNDLLIFASTALRRLHHQSSA